MSKPQKLELTWISKDEQPRRKNYWEVLADWLEAGDKLFYDDDDINDGC